MFLEGSKNIGDKGRKGAQREALATK